MAAKKELPEITAKYVLIALVTLATILGYFVFKQINPLPYRENTKTPGENSDELTAEEKKLLTPPAVNASQKEKDDYFKLIEGSAKEATYLDIGGCRADPAVFKTRKGATLSVRNQDPIDRTMVIDADHIYTVPGKQTKELKVDFGKGAGIYGFGCDNSTEAVGMMLVAE